MREPGSPGLRGGGEGATGGRWEGGSARLCPGVAPRARFLARRFSSGVVQRLPPRWAVRWAPRRVARGLTRSGESRGRGGTSPGRPWRPAAARLLQNAGPAGASAGEFRAGGRGGLFAGNAPGRWRRHPRPVGFSEEPVLVVSEFSRCFPRHALTLWFCFFFSPWVPSSLCTYSYFFSSFH